MKNPANFAKHQSNPKVGPVIAKMMTKLGGGPKWILLDAYKLYETSTFQPSGIGYLMFIAFLILTKLFNFLPFVSPVS